MQLFLLRPAVLHVRTHIHAQCPPAAARDESGNLNVNAYKATA